MPGLSETVQEVTDFVKEKIEESEDFIIVESETRDGISGALQRILGDVTASSASRQAAVGGITGCVAGYLTNKVGRAVGLSLAGTFILFQVAQHKGYINVNWTKVKRAMSQAKAQAKIDELKLRQASVTGKIRNFVEDNYILSTGFMGGFAVGLFVF